MTKRVKRYLTLPIAVTLSKRFGKKDPSAKKFSQAKMQNILGFCMSLGMILFTIQKLKSFMNTNYQEAWIIPFGQVEE